MPSSIRPTRDSSLRIRIAPEELTLRDWPLVDRPVGSWSALALAIGLSCLAGWAASSVALGMAVGLLLAITLWKTWLPLRYQLGGSGIAQQFLFWRRRIPWTAIRRHELRTGGVLLVPDHELTTLAPLRGLYLHWGSRKAEVLSHLDYYLQSWNATPQPAAEDSATR